ncbi:MAG: murein L,D-transpeptidase family protein [Armatimonadota bacterium]
MPTASRTHRRVVRLLVLGVLLLPPAVGLAVWAGGKGAVLERPVRGALGTLRGADERTSPSLRELCRQQGLSYPPPKPSLVLHKGRRELVLLSGGEPLTRYRVGLGGAPEGDKEREGDRRTPEGRFYVCTRLRQSRFHRFLGLSYPAPDDVERGLAAGQITRGEHRAILAAHQGRRQPSWSTALGGAIGIHGGGGQRDWTLGCIAVSDPEIEELFESLPLGTEIEIQP